MSAYPLNGKSLEINAQKCTGCGLCIEVCPHEVFAFIEENRAVQIVYPDFCMECGACALNCPINAIKVNRGVGCAAAVIGSILGKKGECSCGNSTPCC